MNKYGNDRFVISLAIIIILIGPSSQSALSISSPQKNLSAGAPEVIQITAHERRATWSMGNISGLTLENIDSDENGLTLSYNTSIFAGEPPINVTPEYPRSIEPDIAVQTDGTIGLTYIEWSTVQQDRDIFAKLFCPNGTQKGEEIIVSSASIYRYDPRIIFNQDGSFTIFWIDLREHPTIGGVYFQKFDSTGNPLTIQTKITDDLYSPEQLNVGKKSDGQVILTWDCYVVGIGTRCLTQFIAANGSFIGGVRDVTIQSGRQAAPDIAVNSNDDFAIAWVANNGYPNQVYFQRFNSTGDPVGDIVQPGPSPRNQSDPAVAFDSKGNFMIAWTDNYNEGEPSTGPIEIHAQLYYPDGQRKGGEINISATPSFRKPDITADSKDNFIVVGDRAFQRIDNDGNLLGCSYPISEEGMFVDSPEVVATAGEEFTVAWADVNVGGEPSKSYIKYSNFKRGAFSPLGTVITPEFRPDHLLNWTAINASFTLPNPAANSVNLSYSLDNGTTWIPALPGQDLSRIPADNGSIRLKAELRTLNRRSSPVLRSLSVDYTINRPPYITSLEPSDLRNATRQQTIPLTAVADDPDGDPLGYSWRQTAGPRVDLMDNGTEAPSFIPSQIGFYTFELRVRDAHLVSGPAYANITVVNLVPVVRIWSDAIPVKNTTVRIHAECWDPDEDSMEYAWLLAQAPAGAQLGETGAAGASLFCPVAGTCSLVLEVKDSEGADVNETLNITFFGRSPIAVLVANRTSARPGSTFGFSAAGSLDPDNDELQYHFDFGDGNNTGWSMSPVSIKTYPNPGNYNVILVVRDNDGNTSVPSTMDITVLPFNAPPRAIFTVVQGNLTTPFRFTSVSTDPDGTISEISWDFGDGTAGTGASVSHLYRSGGDFNVTLTVTDNENAQSVCVTLIRINRAPEIRSFLPVRNVTIRVDDGLNFSIAVTDPDGDILKTRWFVNGMEMQNNTDMRFHYIFHVDGAFVVTATVEDGRDGTASTGWNVTVKPMPVGTTIVVEPASLLPLIIIIVVAIVSILVYLIRRRRSLDETSKPDEDTVTGK